MLAGMDESCRIAAALFGECPEMTWNGVSRSRPAEEDQYARYQQGESGVK
jgi:hypothetical protein